MVAAANVNVPGSNILIPHSRPHATVQDQDQDRHFTTWLLNWSKRLSKGCWKIGSLAADMSQASYLISFKTWGMFGRCVNDDNWITRIVQAVAITPGCWWRYAPAVCAVELVLACRNPGWDWKFFPNFSIIVMLEIIMKTSSQPRPWPAASTGTSESQCWHQCTLFSQCLENAPTFNYGHLWLLTSLNTCLALSLNRFFNMKVQIK